MRMGSVLPVILSAGLALGTPAVAQDLGDVLSGVAKNLIAQEQDKAAYIQAQNTNTIAAYNNYLRQYPNGTYRGNAQQALRSLGAGNQVTPLPQPNVPPLANDARSDSAQDEARIGLSRSQRLQLQRDLTALGYDVGVADGLWGTRTRKALQEWQGKNAFAKTGYVNGRQVELITTQARGSVGSVTPAPSSSANDQAEERLLALTPAERRAIQIELTRQGYNTFGADGVFGRNSRSALAAWQRQQGQPVTGYLTADQVHALNRAMGR